MNHCERQSTWRRSVPGWRLLYIAAELKICCDGLIVTSGVPIERYRKN